jgi:hypothetical protein
MLPGAISSFSLNVVWTESMITALARSCSRRRESSRPTFRDNVQFTLSVHPTLAPHLDLLRAFFSGGIQHNAGSGQMRSDIQHERGFPHSGIASQENERARDDAAAENTIEFGNSRRYSRRFDPGDFVNRIGTNPRTEERRRSAVTRSSTNVFHSWHEGHRPIHLGEVWPHCWQAY